jgi:hypothetical protein
MSGTRNWILDIGYCSNRKWRKRMKIWNLLLTLVLATGVLAACGGGDASPAGDTEPPAGDAEPTVEEQDTPAQDTETGGGSEGYTSEALDESYDGALPVGSQLALGIFELKETESAVTAEQAASLLPLWQAIQGGTLQGDAETNAVLKQIERTMTAEQLAAIAALGLTFEDMGAWMQEQGVNFGRPEGAGERQNLFGDMSEEERAAMRATRQAGGGFGGEGGPFGDMSEEQRESMRATAEAGGLTFPGGGAPGGGPGGFARGQLTMLAELVVELLTELVGQ